MVIFIQIIDLYWLNYYCYFYYCTVLNIQRHPIVGDIVAVKCVDKFYRGKIIDILDQSCFSLYLIDTGYVISASIECIVDLLDDLKMVKINIVYI